jgi:hypothetical protein
MGSLSALGSYKTLIKIKWDCGKVKIRVERGWGAGSITASPNHIASYSQKASEKTKAEYSDK